MNIMELDSGGEPAGAALVVKTRYRAEQAGK